MPFAPANDSLLSRIEPGALGSSLVLLALIGGIGYGGYRVLQEVQRVQVTPVDQTPIVLSELDPLEGAISPAAAPDEAETQQAGVFTPPTTEAFDRLYRPQALDVPVLVARDAPISTLDPERVGVFAGRRPSNLPRVQDSSLAAAALTQRLVAEGVIAESQVPDGPAVQTANGVTVIAVRPAWIEVRDETSGVLLSRVLNAGDTFSVPQSAVNPNIRVGESGAVYFNVDGKTFGPSGAPGRVTSNISLAAADIVDRYPAADSSKDADLLATLIDLDLTGPRVAAAQDGPAQALTFADLLPTATAPAEPTLSPMARPATITAAAAEPEPALPTVAPEAPVVEQAAPVMPRVTAEPVPGITVVATAETWVEVTSPSGKKLFARTLQPGETYQVPQTEQPPTIFSGNAGGVFFAVNGKTYGPYGESGQFGRNLALSAPDIQGKMQVADLTQNRTLAKVVAELQLQGQ